MRHLTQRLALLLASFQGASRVAKRKDRQNIEAGRDVEQRLDFLEPPKPTQFEPTLSAHAVNSMDWIARLASETANRVLSVATTIANGACATYGPLEARAPSWRSVSASRITMKCHGCLFIPLPVRRPASTIRRITVSGTGLFW